MHRFLIIRLSSLGDIIHTLPAFSALRSAFLDAHITWVVEEPGREILELVPGLDHIEVVRAKQQKWYTRLFRSELAELRRNIQAREQVALDFQGLIKSGLITRLSGAKQRIGFHRTDLREPAASFFYTHKAAKFEGKHVIRKNLNLLKVLGIQQDELVFPIVLPESLQSYVLEKLNSLGFDGQSKLVVANVGAAWETKRWSADKWIQMLKVLSANSGIFPVILWGTEQERLLAQEITEGSQVPAVPFLSLKETMALLIKADLVVSGDTFALQFACALARPVVGIFGPTDPERNGSFRKNDRSAFQPMECSYCYKRICPNVKCLEALDPEHVADLCLERLDIEHLERGA